MIKEALMSKLTDKDNRIKLIACAYLILTILVCAVTFILAYRTGEDEIVYTGECDLTADYAAEGYEGYGYALKRGVYDIAVAYTSNGFATVGYEISEASGGETASELLLTPYDNYVTERIYITEDDSSVDLTINAAYEGMSLRLMAVNIVRERRLSASYEAVRLFAYMIALYMLITVCLWLVRSKTDGRYRIRLGILTVIVISSVGLIHALMHGYLEGGHDAEAHMGRIAAIATGLKAGIFPVRMYSHYANDRGYPMGVFYGDIFLYPSAILHMLGVALWKCYVFYAALMNVLTAVMAYISFSLILRVSIGSMSDTAAQSRGNTELTDGYAALMAAAVYTLSLWRLNDLYIRAAAGEYGAMAFLPLIAAGLYIAVYGSKKRGDISAYGVLCLTVGYTGVIHTHMLTSVMATLFGAAFCLMFIRRLAKGGGLRTIGISAVLTILVNATFIVPFMDFYLSDDYVVKHLTDRIQDQGVYPLQLISLKGDYSGISHALGEGVALSEEMPFAIGYGLLLILLMLLCLSVRERTGIGLYLIIGAIIALWLSTCYFPYDYLAEHVRSLSAILARVQFPWRYLVMATMLLSVGSLYLYRRLSKGRTLYICILALITLVMAGTFMYDQLHADNKHIDAASVDGLKMMILDTDIMYLPQAMDTGLLKDGVPEASDEELYVQDMGYDGAGYTVGLENSSQDTAYLKLPLIYYKGYHTYEEDGSGGRSAKDILDVLQAEDHRVMLAVPSGYKGVVGTAFFEPWYWRLAELISILTVTGMIIYGKRR